MEKNKFDNFIKTARKINKANDIKKGDLLLKTVSIEYDWFYFGIVLETNHHETKTFLLDHINKINVGNIVNDHHGGKFKRTEICYYAR